MPKHLKHRNTPSAEVAALLASGIVGTHAVILDDNDIVWLLRAAVEREGSQGRFREPPWLRTHSFECRFEWK
jgi:predicted RNase H-like nuclease (RuvC/YqgF family)